MQYCVRCKHVFEDGEEKCPFCRKRKIRDAQPGDICFLEEKEPVLAGILEEILQQNGVDVLTESSIGAGLATIAGTMLELIRLYVRYEDLEKVLVQKFVKVSDGGVYSCEEGVVKPDEQIYTVLLERYGLKAEETIFIDDGRRNIRAARKLGFHTVRHINNRRTMSEVCRIIALE